LQDTALSILKHQPNMSITYMFTNLIEVGIYDVVGKMIITPDEGKIRFSSKISIFASKPWFVRIHKYMLRPVAKHCQRIQSIKT
jgi:hypothetical protein